MSNVFGFIPEGGYLAIKNSAGSGNYVTLDTTQTITGLKTFDNYLSCTSNISASNVQASNNLNAAAVTAGTIYPTTAVVFSDGTSQVTAYKALTPGTFSSCTITVDSHGAISSITTGSTGSATLVYAAQRTASATYAPVFATTTPDGYKSLLQDYSALTWNGTLLNATQLQSTTLFTTSSIQTNGTLNVAGQSTLANTTVSGSLNANGTSTFTQPVYINVAAGGAALNGLEIRDTTSADYFQFIPNTTNGVLNGIVVVGDSQLSAIGNVLESQSMVLTVWSNTKTGLRISPYSVMLGAGGSGGGYTPTSAITCSGTTMTITGNTTTAGNITATGSGKFIGDGSLLTAVNDTTKLPLAGGIVSGALGIGGLLNTTSNIETTGIYTSTSATPASRKIVSSIYQIQDDSAVASGANVGSIYGSLNLIYYKANTGVTVTNLIGSTICSTLTSSAYQIYIPMVSNSNFLAEMGVTFETIVSGTSYTSLVSMVGNGLVLKTNNNSGQISFQCKDSIGTVVTTLTSTATTITTAGDVVFNQNPFTSASQVRNNQVMPANNDSSNIVPTTAWVQSAISAGGGATTSINGLYLAGNASQSCVGNGHPGFAGQTGSNNTQIGYNSGYALTSGANNTLIGSRAGYTITTGNLNICIGNTAAYSADATMYNNICIGNSMTPPLNTYSNAIFIGNGSHTNYQQGQWNNNNTKFEVTSTTAGNYYFTVPAIVPPIIFLKGPTTSNVIIFYITLPDPSISYVGCKVTFRWLKPSQRAWYITSATSTPTLVFRLDAPTTSINIGSTTFSATFLCDGQYWYTQEFLT